MEDFVIKNSRKDKAFKLFVGGILLIFGLATITYYVGIIFILMALFAMFYNSGIEFNMEYRTVRSFVSLFGFVRGKWISLNEFHAITTKSSRKGYRIYSRSNTSSIDTLSRRYEVYLVGKENINTILLLESSQKYEAVDFANEISNKLKINQKPYGRWK